VISLVLIRGRPHLKRQWTARGEEKIDMEERKIDKAL